MFTRSIWNAMSANTSYPALASDLSADIVIIGGGITGISAAKQLRDKGRNVIVVEAREIGRGSTGHSTGNLYCTIDQNLSRLAEKYDMDTVARLISSRKSAIAQIESNVRTLELDCDFRRVPWYLFSGADEDTEWIRKELQVARESGLQASEGRNDEIPVNATSVLRVEDQAQINPLAYVQQLAESIDPGKEFIYENTPVHNVVRKDKGFQVQTPGALVSANHVIHATHSPKGVRFIQTLLGPYREYGIACRVEESLPDGIFWGYYGENKISLRKFQTNGEEFLMVIGQPHKVGQATDNEARVKSLEAYAREHFNLTEVSYRWGGQNYKPADMLPYIGREIGKEDEYIATGFATDGLVYGTLAATIITDMLSGIENEFESLYKPARQNLIKSAGRFLKENLNVAAQYFKNIPGVEDLGGTDTISPGCGDILHHDGHKYAVYRNEDGTLEYRSAICPHLGCVVAWNNAEKTWDCPCHGTRFARDGSVLEGPAFEGLKDVDENPE